MLVPAIVVVVGEPLDPPVPGDPGTVLEGIEVVVVVVVVLVVVVLVVIDPGESMGTMNLPGGIKDLFGCGNFRTGWPASA